MLTAAVHLAQVPMVSVGLIGWDPGATWAFVGALLSVAMGVALDVSGALEKMRNLRRQQRKTRQREKKAKEARESHGGPRIDELGRPLKPSRRGRQAIRNRSPYIPDKQDRAPEGSPFVAAFRSLRDGFRMVLQGVTELFDLVDSVRWVLFFYLLMAAGLIWLEPLMEKLGFSAEAATGAVTADIVLAILTSAWVLTGIRTAASPIARRLLETVVLVVVFGCSWLVVAATGTFTYGALGLFFGGFAYLKAFQR